MWDWGEQFSDKDIVLFANPLYKKPPEPSRKTMAFLPPTAIPLPGLHQTGSRMTMHFSQMTSVASQLPEVCLLILTAEHFREVTMVVSFRNDFSNHKQQFVT